MAQLHEITIAPLPIERFLPLLGERSIRQAERVAAAGRRRMAGRVFWNVNSTASGGGVAEMLRSKIAYARGAGVDARWLVIEGTPDFFHLTKRLHHALHGSPGDGSPLGDAQRLIYEQVLWANGRELASLVRPRDVVVLHDPQTAGLVPQLADMGAIVIWRSHIGDDRTNDQTELGWAFLRPYLTRAAAYVFSRQAYIPAWLHGSITTIIQPSIDAFSAKNQELDQATVRAILVHTGLVEGPPGEGNPSFLREDGSPGRVDRAADVIRLGRAPAWETPLVVQISRWDPLKDHRGVMQGFGNLVERGDAANAHLLLAGPNVSAVVDDPEGAATLTEVQAAWRALPHASRRRVHLACLPMADAEENAAIVNALQRHASVVVQKSLREGFGLTVTEAMWKARPIVASAVGGIQDQIVDGQHGLLLRDPSNLDEFGATLERLLDNPPLADQLGRQAHERARDEYLGIRHLIQYERLIERIEASSARRVAAD